MGLVILLIVHREEKGSFSPDLESLRCEIMTFIILIKETREVIGIYQSFILELSLVGHISLQILTFSIITITDMVLLI